MSLFRAPLWGLYRCTIRQYYTVKSDKAPKDAANALFQQITSKIKATGPITVADYMRQVLTDPSGGYYMHRDVFGASGDFVTSPELSQMFGEMIAVWFLNEWSKLGSPKPVQIVELGPGRGALSQDLLRVFSHFDALKGTSLNLVEVSPFLSDLQARRICFQSKNVLDKGSPFYREGVSHEGVPVRWFRSLEVVPEMFTLLVAHEFFDALPIHKFQKTEEGYREVLVDIDEGKDNSFRFIIAREATPMSKVLIESGETREHLEISPETLILSRAIAQRIETHGGLALIADYGHLGDGKDTFRAFKKHQLHDPLVEPGNADLTADVDFNGFKKAALEAGGVLVFGPRTQREFLTKMGIEQRLKALEASATEKQLEALRFGYEMMTKDDKMGKRFKFLAIAPEVAKTIYERHPAVGFN